MSAAFDGTHPYGFGGFSLYYLHIWWCRCSDEGFRFDPITESVSLLPERLPHKAFRSSALWAGNEMLIAGGGSDQGLYGWVVRYRPVPEV